MMYGDRPTDKLRIIYYIEAGSVLIMGVANLTHGRKICDYTIFIIEAGK